MGSKKSIIYFVIVLSIFLSNIHGVKATSQIINTTATASNSYPGFPASNVVDNNPSTLWNSGATAPQSITLDLQIEHTINQIQLVVSQTPKGRSIHQIEAGSSLTNLSPIFKIDQILTEGETIKVNLLYPAKNVRYVKITGLGGESWISWRDIKVFSGNTNANHNLKYYGYLSYDGLIPTLGPTYLSELDSLGNTNITWTSYSHVGEFSSHNIRSIVTDIRAAFFEQNGQLATDWEARWARMQTIMNPIIGQIAAFYFDEPVWNNMSYENFRMATKKIREVYPNTPILVIEAAPPLRSNSIPSNYYEFVTDLGFDYYFTNETPDNNTGWGEYLSLHENLKPHLVGKKLWIVPDGYGNNYARWDEAYERYLSLALTTESTAGIVGFIYQWPMSDISLRSLLIPGQPQYNPNFRSRQIEIGKAIIKNNSPTPSPIPIAKPGDLNSDSKIDIFDFNLLISKFGNPYTIFDFNAIVSNYGK